MATEPKADPAPSRLGSAIKRWISNRSAADVPAAPNAGMRLLQADDWGESWIADPVSMQFLSGTVNRQIRSRQQVYEKWQDMTADPVISSAMRAHVTGALGGHESRGEMVFLEPTADAKKNAKEEALVKALAEDLQPLFNRIAFTVSFNAVTFGDAYGRVYGAQGLGVQDVYVDELMYPPLVQPYERANTTVGFTMSTGSNFTERLSVLQVARMKMPRTMYIPQNRVVEKAIRVSMKTDRVEDLLAVPALAGGSFLDGSEVAYDKFSAAWTGLTGQRVMDSIDENLVGVTMTGATPQQRVKFIDSLKRMFAASNANVRARVQAGISQFERIWHFVPTSSDKQMTEIRGAASAGRPSSLTIDDVMMNARFLAGSLGLDLSILGFADQLGGGLGEGGFFRVSVQSAERSRAIRSALTDFLNHIIEIHLLYKHGIDMKGKKRPWQVNFFSGISAMETERAKTKADNMNSGALLVQTLAQMKDLGLDEDAVAHILETEVGLDADSARMYAKSMAKAAAEAAKKEAEANGGGGGGGFGGGGPPGGPAGDGVDPLTPEG
jgi:hypothetical protein